MSDCVSIFILHKIKASSVLSENQRTSREENLRHFWDLNVVSEMLTHHVAGFNGSNSMAQNHVAAFRFISHQILCKLWQSYWFFSSIKTENGLKHLRIMFKLACVFSCLWYESNKALSIENVFASFARYQRTQNIMIWCDRIVLYIIRIVLAIVLLFVVFIMTIKKYSYKNLSLN